MSNVTEEAKAGSIAGKYLTLILADEAYGIAVLKVREIIRHQKITSVPQMPDFIKGIINLRGRVIPVVDLRIKFGLSAEITERTCIIVVQVDYAGGLPLQVGLVVDSVEEVVNLTESDIQPTPEFGTQVDTSYLLGMAKIKDQVKTLLDIDKVVAAESLATIARLSQD